MPSFDEYLRQYNILKDVFGCRDATPVIARAEVLNTLHSNPKSPEGEITVEMAATQVIIKSSIIDQATWTWWVGDNCPDYTDRKIEMTRANDFTEGRGFSFKCFERKHRLQENHEAWDCVGEGGTVVEAVYSATVTDQFGEEGGECPGGESPRQG